MMLAYQSHAVVSLDLQMGYVFNGLAPSSNPPWVNLFFQDTSPGHVTLAVTAPGLVTAPGQMTPEDMTDLYLNFNPMLDVTKLSITPPSQNFNGSAPQEGEDKFKADGDGKYDILLNFGQGNNGMQHGQTFQFTMTYSGSGHTLTSTDFDFLSSPGSGGNTEPFYAAAHIQNTPGGGCWIAAPEANFGFFSAVLGASLSCWVLVGRARQLS